MRSLLLSKIHNATLTDANLDYVGSIGIDANLLETAGILPYEQVQVVNITNGTRLTTYAIEAPPNSGKIELNGAAARLGMKGDRVIIMTYGLFSTEEARSHQPKVVILDRHNQILDVRP